VKDFVAECKRYGCYSVTGDRYGAQWVVEQFEKNGVTYTQSEKSKSDIYLSLLPAVNSRQVELLDHRKLLQQLAGLERRTRSGGKDQVDHRPGLHDDVANAVAGVLVLAAGDSGVLGAVEALKMIASGAVQLDGMARYNAPPDPNSPAPSTETRTCSQCQGTMRPQAERRDTFVCASCGHCETISSVIAVSPSRTAYFAASAEPRRLKGFGRFGE
jgi:hypothetical protein